MTISLVEVTKDNLGKVLRLKVTKAQNKFVAPNAISISEAYFEPAAWFRTIAKNNEPVGFAMVFDPTLTDEDMKPQEKETLFLWRFMLDQAHQGQGYGRAALDLLVEHARSRPDVTRFATSYVEGPGGPEGFYLGYGFTKTGDIEDGEVVVAIDL